MNLKFDLMVSKAVLISAGTVLIPYRSCLKKKKFQLDLNFRLGVVDALLAHVFCNVIKYYFYY